MNPTRKTKRFEQRCPEVSIGQYTDDICETVLWFQFSHCELFIYM